MRPQPQDTNVEKQWESVHQCPECGHITNLADIDLPVVATGVISCPTCDWSGVVKIDVIEIETPQT